MFRNVPVVDFDLNQIRNQKARLSLRYKAEGWALTNQSTDKDNEEFLHTDNYHNNSVGMHPVAKSLSKLY